MVCVVFLFGAVEQSMFLQVLMTKMYLLLVNETTLVASVAATLLLQCLVEIWPGCAFQFTHSLAHSLTHSLTLHFRMQNELVLCCPACTYC